MTRTVVSSDQLDVLEACQRLVLVVRSPRALRRQLPGCQRFVGRRRRALTSAVAQKTYGYTDNGTVPSANLTQALKYTDKKLGKFLDQLKSAGTYESTLLIVGAKHGQSPKNRSLRRIVNDTLLQSVSDVTYAGIAADDGAYIARLPRCRHR